MKAASKQAAFCCLLAARVNSQRLRRKDTNAGYAQRTMCKRPRIQRVRQPAMWNQITTAHSNTGTRSDQTTNMSSPSSQAPTMSQALTPASQPVAATRLELIALALAYLGMYVPTYITLDRDIWSVVGQGHGPVILALTGWLAWQRWPALLASPNRSHYLAATASLLMGLASYILGRSQTILMLEVVSQIFVLTAILSVYKGLAAVKLMWFPLFFMIFLIPFPSTLVDMVTGPLKQGVSVAAEAILYAAKYPIGRSGVTITIGSYKLLVADACAGLNSIFALESIGIFYMSIVRHTSTLRNILLAVMIIPISFASNVIRVVVLILVTYYFGDEAGQGFVHGFAGILLFMVATTLVIGLDTLIGFFIHDTPKPEQHAA
jgi:exosortase B